MRQIRHPLVERDIIGIVDHIIEATDGNIEAARKRLNEIDALIGEIAGNPNSGNRLSGALKGWLARHGGRGNRLTIVFKFDADVDAVLIAMIAFGGRNWLEVAETRDSPGIW